MDCGWNGSGSTAYLSGLAADAASTSADLATGCRGSPRGAHTSPARSRMSTFTRRCDRLPRRSLRQTAFPRRPRLTLDSSRPVRLATAGLGAIAPPPTPAGGDGSCGPGAPPWPLRPLYGRVTVIMWACAAPAREAVLAACTGRAQTRQQRVGRFSGRLSVVVRAWSWRLREMTDVRRQRP